MLGTDVYVHRSDHFVQRFILFPDAREVSFVSRMKVSTFIFSLFRSLLSLFFTLFLSLSLFVSRVCSFRWARLAFSFLVPEFLFFCLFQDWRVDEAETRGDCVLSLLHWKFFFFFPLLSVCTTLEWHRLPAQRSRYTW